jgi:polyribonucleotide nucleotidyltransferase
MSKHNLLLGGRDFVVSLNNLAERTNGEAMVRYGDTVVFATVTMAESEVEKDFFPLSVNYEEKFYAGGKISGSRYSRREGKPSDRATLISRMIDRAIRPLFPEGMKKEIQITITCLSWDGENDPGTMGMIASSLALHLSDIPWNGPLAAVRIGKTSEYILNPNYTERKDGSMDVVVSGFYNNNNEFIVNMIEGCFKEEEESSVLEAFRLSEEPIKQLCAFQNKIKEEEGKEKIVIAPLFESEKIKEDIKNLVEEKIISVFNEEKGKEEKLKEIEKETTIFIKENYEEKKEVEYAFACLEKIIEKIVRTNVLEKENRLDGRKIDEVRKITCSVGLLPRTHGSALFERGQTKAFSIVTLGAPGEEQLTDDMEFSEKKRFMHHYNFPPYSVGEVGGSKSPGRREIGHGMLAENALSPLIPDIDVFPYTIRVVSEIVSSNGSTSMASVCGTTLALLDAGVPLKKPVAGISIGLVTGEGGKYKLLTDIQGKEDHYGDMDFKVAGTEKGVTAIQLDVKIDGLTKKIIEDTLERAKNTRLYLLEEIRKTLPTHRPQLSPYAPKIVTIKIDPEKIGEIIGPRGKMINEIIEETGANIDIDDSGLISITSTKEESIEKALTRIKNIVRELKVGELFQGKVVKLFAFGAVVEILPGKEGLVHISEIADRRIDKVEDVLEIGQEVPVKIIKLEPGGKMSLSIKQAKK